MSQSDPYESIHEVTFVHNQLRMRRPFSFSTRLSHSSQLQAQHLECSSHVLFSDSVTRLWQKSAEPWINFARLNVRNEFISAVFNIATSKIHRLTSLLSASRATLLNIKVTCCRSIHNGLCSRKVQLDLEIWIWTCSGRLAPNLSSGIWAL